jgi:hypothetical protein
MAIELALLELHYPGRAPTLAGFVLHDGERLEWRLLGDWSFIGDAVDQTVLANTKPFVEALAAEYGATRSLEMLEDQLSNILRLSTRVQLRPLTEMPLAGLADRLAQLLLGLT